LGNEPIDLKKAKLTVANGQSGNGTKIDTDGKLIVGSDQPAARLTISGTYTDTDTSGKTVTGTAVVLVVNPSTKSIKEKFGIETEGTTAVTKTFNALHEFIKAGGLTNENTSSVIQLGDWIDLEGGLEIAANYDAGFDSDKVTDWDTPIEGHGNLSRLIVVGINSFQNSSESDGYKYPDEEDTPPAHVVFQFQNIPHRHLMSTKYDGSSAGGYPESHMKEYLEGYFLPGLITAGVPAAVLWPPARKVATRVQSSSEQGDFLAQIKVKLWLPTAWEMAGGTTNNVNDEAAVNQTWLKYYADDGKRIKYGTSAAARYWLASTTVQSDSAFVVVNNNGNMSTDADVLASNELGVAPAFCVQ
jgi:hypothetical protein